MAQKDDIAQLDIISVGILHEAVLRYSEQSSIPQLWAEVARNVRWIAPASRVCLLLIGTDSETSCEVAARFEKGSLLESLVGRFELGDDLVGQSLSTTRPRWFHNYNRQASPDDELREWLIRCGQGELLAVPVSSGLGRLGALLLDFTAPLDNVQRARTAALVTLYARHAATTFHLVRSNTELSAKNEQLEETRLRLLAASDEVRQFNDTLERRIEERTAELESAQQELIKKERLAVLGQLTGSVAHELRNPLSVIATSVHILKTKGQNNGAAAETTIARLERNVARCDKIVDELLDLTRDQPLSRQPILIDQWLNELIHDEEGRYEDVIVQKKIDLGKIELDGDPERLRRAVHNIFGNAMDAVRLRIKHAQFEGSEYQPVICVSGRLGCNDRVDIEIEDNGLGMPDEVYEKMFEPLFSTKGFGVGLGMTIVKEIMIRHGGDIEIETVEGVCTLALLWLPLTAQS